MNRGSVGLIGNMNNNFFPICRYLRDFGYDAHLFLLQEPEHFLPESDTTCPDYKEYTHKLDWIETTWWPKIRRDIINEVGKFDFIFSTDRAPAFLQKAGIKSDIYVPHGDDLLYLTMYKSPHIFPKRWEINKYLQAFYQRKNIAQADNYWWSSSSEIHLKMLKKMNRDGNHINTLLPVLYLPQYTSEKFLAFPSLDLIRQRIEMLRSNNDLLIFSHSRHIWNDNSCHPSHHKGTEKFLPAFLQFVNKYRNSFKIKLITCEYGWDVNKTKNFINDNGLASNVEWLPVLSRNEIMTCLKYVDIACSEFCNGWYSSGVITEILASAKPILGYRNENGLDKENDNYPLINAYTVDEIFSGLEGLVFDKKRYEEMAIAGNNWFKFHGVEKPLKKIMELIDKKIQGTITL